MVAFQVQLKNEKTKNSTKANVRRTKCRGGPKDWDRAGTAAAILFKQKYENIKLVYIEQMMKIIRPKTRLRILRQSPTYLYPVNDRMSNDGKET